MCVLPCVEYAVRVWVRSSDWILSEKSIHRLFEAKVLFQQKISNTSPFPDLFPPLISLMTRQLICRSFFKNKYEFCPVLYS